MGLSADGGDHWHVATRHGESTFGWADIVVCKLIKLNAITFVDTRYLLA